MTGDGGARTGDQPRRRDVLRRGGMLAAAVGGVTGAGGFAVARRRRRRRRPPDSASTTLLWQNAWLTDGAQGALGLPFDVGSKPQYRERAAELGRRLAEDGYDVVALGEVFNEEQTTVADAFAATGRDVDAVQGPEPDGFEKGAGLLDLVAGPTVTDHATVEYETEFDDWLTYVEAHVGKGANYVELDLGPGRVDLFSTHLAAGSLLPWASSGDADVAEKRRQQLDELEAFVREHRRPENVTVVVGDINVDGADPEYPAVTGFADSLGLYDAWERHASGHGGTNDTAITEACSFDSDDAPPAYCTGGDGGKRIDYAFVEVAQDSHALELTVDEIRRRAFWRELAPPDRFYADDAETVPNYLCDHLGLELSLEVAGR